MQCIWNLLLFQWAFPKKRGCSFVSITQQANGQILLLRHGAEVHLQSHHTIPSQTTVGGWKATLHLIPLLRGLSTTSVCFCPLSTASTWDRRPQHCPIFHILCPDTCREIQGFNKCFIGIKMILLFTSSAQPHLHKHPLTYPQVLLVYITLGLSFKQLLLSKYQPTKIFKHSNTVTYS